MQVCILLEFEFCFLYFTWVDTRLADEWQAVAPRRPKQSGKQPGSAAAPPYLRLKMPRGTRPGQVLPFEYASFRCTFEVPKAYDGREEVRTGILWSSTGR